jgi:predicted ATPase
MKIKNLYIKNFKSIKEVSLDLQNLNVFAGMNGMGKSSVIQTLLLLKQSGLDVVNGRIELNNDSYVSLGAGKDVLYQSAEDKIIAFALSSNDKTIMWDLRPEPERRYILTEKPFSKNFKYEYLENFVNLFHRSLFQYLNAERIGPQVTYASSSYLGDIGQIGSKGEYAVYFLNIHGNEKVKYKTLLHTKAKSATLIHQVDAWLGEISPGTKLNTTNIPGTDLVLLDFQFETSRDYSNRFRPVNVGFGLSYVLPVIVALLTAEKDKLIIIENPEAHLHPRGQAEMGKLIALAAETGAQLIIETHSDHLLNGIRVAVKEKIMSEQNVAVFYFNRVNTEGGEQYSKVTTIKIDRNGEFSEYPKDFMDEWSNQLYKLI